MRWALLSVAILTTRGVAAQTPIVLDLGGEYAATEAHVELGWAESAVGALMGTTTVDAVVVDGVAVAIIGPNASWLDDARYLAVSIDGVALSGRVALLSSPIAVVARRTLDASRLTDGSAATDFSRIGHAHTLADIVDAPSTLPPAPHVVAWSDLDGVPAAFAPEAHLAFTDVLWDPSVLDGLDALSTGDVVRVVPGVGLVGGGDTGDVTVDVGLGSLDGDVLQPGSVLGTSVLSGEVQLRIGGNAGLPTACLRGPGYTSYSDCTLVVCPDLTSGQVRDCRCPGNLIVEWIGHEDVSGDGVGTERVRWLSCCSPY